MKWIRWLGLIVCTEAAVCVESDQLTAKMWSYRHRFGLCDCRNVFVSSVIWDDREQWKSFQGEKKSLEKWNKEEKKKMHWKSKKNYKTSNEIKHYCCSCERFGCFFGSGDKFLWNKLENLLNILCKEILSISQVL